MIKLLNFLHCREVNPCAISKKYLNSSYRQVDAIMVLMFSIEIWNDMRRYDFDKNIFLNWDIPAYHLKNANATRAIQIGRAHV